MWNLPLLFRLEWWFWRIMWFKFWDREMCACCIENNTVVLQWTVLITHRIREFWSVTAVGKEGPLLGWSAPLPQLRKEYVAAGASSASEIGHEKNRIYLCLLQEPNLRARWWTCENVQTTFSGGDQYKRTSGRVHKVDLLPTFVWLTAEKCNWTSTGLWIICPSVKAAEKDLWYLIDVYYDPDERFYAVLHEN